MKVKSKITHWMAVLLRSSLPFLLSGIIIITNSFAFSTPLSPGAQVTGKRLEKRFAIELFGGYLRPSFGDLNLLVDYDRGFQQFTYDDRYNHLRSEGLIASWNKNVEEEFYQMTTALPVGFRLKYFMTPRIAFSLSYSAWRSKRSSQPTFLYSRDFSYGDRYFEYLDYETYELSVTAHAPRLGIHYTQPLGRRLQIEAFAAGGPLFVSIKTFSEWDYTFTIDEGYGPFEPFSSSGLLEQKGTGVGLAAEGGFQLNFRIGRGWGLWVEGSYLVQSVGSISGTGRQELNGNSESWEGRWKVYTVNLRGEWGERVLEYPTNLTLEDNFYMSERNARLKLSGPQLKLGVFFRF